MKHFSLICLFSLALASCKKDYTCTCYIGKGFSNSTPSRVVTMNEVNKKTAKANCISTIQTYSETCTLSH